MDTLISQRQKKVPIGHLASAHPFDGVALAADLEPGTSDQLNVELLPQ